VVHLLVDRFADHDALLPANIPSESLTQFSGESLDSDIIIVSGLPRSGTSVMMQMLQAGGIEVVTDNVRMPDLDNPRGYFEFEQVKRIKSDQSWLPAMRGKAFKMVSQLLYELPATERYCIIFMNRDLNEVLASQEKMLARLKKPAVATQEIMQAFSQHLARLLTWVESCCNMSILRVEYEELMEAPLAQAARLNEFLLRRLNVESAAEVVDRTLYRNRKRAIDPVDDSLI
jgi:hypothetical protein